VLKQDGSASSDENDLYKCALIALPRRSYLIVSAYAVDRRRGSSRSIALSIPKALLKNNLPRNGRLEYVTLNPERDIYRVLKSDLARADNLKPEYAKHEGLVAGVRLMAKSYAVAGKMIETNYSRYRRQMEQSLTLKPCPHTMATKGALLSFAFPAATDSLYVFVW